MRLMQAEVHPLTRQQARWLQQTRRCRLLKRRCLNTSTLCVALLGRLLQVCQAELHLEAVTTAVERLMMELLGMEQTLWVETRHLVAQEREHQMVIHTTTRLLHRLLERPQQFCPRTMRFATL